MANTYWSNNGKHQTLANKLNELIPNSGEVENKRKNKALEKFRKASNCYYDLYNNGLFNRATSFYHTFKIASSKYKTYNHNFDEVLYKMVESKMDEIVQAAAKEQNIL